MSAILFDLDGVLYEGNRAIEGAAEAVEWFEQKKIPHLFLTNTSSRPRSALVKKLAGFGIHTTETEFLTPPVATAQWLKQNRIDGPIALFIPEATREEFTDFEICKDNTEKAQAVVVGDLGNAWDFATLNRAFRLLIDKPETVLIALGMTRYWRAEDGLRLDAGPYVSALQYATGKEAVVLGKPAVDFYRSGLRLINTMANDTLMIGDDIKGDIEAAQNVGLKTIQVRTGKFSPADLRTGIQPDAMLDSIADLVEWWKANN